MFKAGSEGHTFNYDIAGLEDAVGRDCAADADARVNNAVAAYYRTGVEYGVAADLDVVADHGTKLPYIGIVLLLGMDTDVGAVGFDIRCDGTGTHM